jgi:hypothetical protein
MTCKCADPIAFGHEPVCEEAPPKPDCECNRRPWPEIEWRPAEGGFERSLIFWPGFSCPVEAPNPGRHGRHGMQLTWALRGPAGTTSLVIWTDWVPGQPTDSSIAHLYPMPMDIGYHSPRWRQGWDMHRCPFLRPCYYNGSSEAAAEIFGEFKSHGEIAIWSTLQDYYERLLLG